MREFAVIGLGRFGASVALTLAELGCEVLGIDKSESKVAAVAGGLAHAMALDVTEEEAIGDLGLHNLDGVIVAIGHDLQASILVTLMLKELGVARVIAKAATEMHGRVLQRIGADRVVFPERDMGVRLAHGLISNDVLDFIRLSPDYGLLEISANCGFAGKTLVETDLRAKHGLTVLAVRTGEKTVVSPGGEHLIENGDILILIGSYDDLSRYEKRLLR